MTTLHGGPLDGEQLDVSALTDDEAALGIALSSREHLSRRCALSRPRAARSLRAACSQMSR
jgi:hypothetical protein